MRLLLVTFAALLCFTHVPAHAQQPSDWPKPDPMTKVGVMALPISGPIAPGAQFDVTLRVAMEPGWHISSIQPSADAFPTAITLSLPEGWTQVGGLQEPTPHPFLFPGESRPTQVHEGQIELRFALRAAEKAPATPVTITGALQVQTCNDRECLPSADVPFSVSVTVGSSQPAQAKPLYDSAKKWGAAITAPERAAPGSTVWVEVIVESAPQWHVYALHGESESTFWTKLEFETLPAGLSWVGDWQAPAPHPFDAFGETVDVYEGSTVFRRALQIASSVPAGEQKIAGVVRAMACNDRTCQMPGDQKLSATLRIDPSAPVGTAGIAPPPASDSAPGQGLLALLSIAVLGAMLSWVMPCVYPMIPINISFFGKLSEQKHVSRVAVATSYGLGITGTFIVIGLVVGVLSQIVSDTASRSEFANLGNTLATNPWINLVIGVMFVAFALSMFGLFEIRVPNFLLNRAGSAGRSAQSAHVGAVLLGVTFALASFTCTVPVVGTLLVSAAQGTAAGLTKSLVGMAVYGAVFAAPFVLLSMSPSFMAALPKAGTWTETIKVGFGFLELAVALKFLWVPDLEWGLHLLTRPVMLWMLLAICVITAAFFLGLIRIGHGDRVAPLRVGIGRWACALICLACAVPVVQYLRAAPHYESDRVPSWITLAMTTILPPAPTDDDLARAEEWFVDDYQAALAQARKQDRPLFVDFTGVYCGNCRVMERTVFPLPEVQALFAQMVRARLYVDRKEARHTEFRRMEVERYQNSSQPYYVMLDPRDETVLVQKGGYIPSGFADVLREGLEAFKRKRAAS